MTLTLTDRDLAILGSLLGDIPHKHAIKIAGFLNEKIAAQHIAEEAKPQMQAPLANGHADPVPASAPIG